MSGAHILDAVTLLIALGRGMYGWRTGFLAGLFSLLGMLAGGIGGLWAGPRLLELLPGVAAHRVGRSSLLVGALLVGATLGELLIGAIGRRMRGGDRAHGVDAAAGLVAAVLAVGVLAWGVLTATRPVAPNALGRAIDDSTVFRALDEAIPDSFNQWPGRAVDAVASRLPGIFGGQEPSLPVPEPDAAAGNAPGVQAAADSIVQVRSDAPQCGTDSTGSGWVAAWQRVITNAHVVAGSRTVEVSVGGTGPALTATVVGFDPDLDLAVLAVPGLAAEPLARSAVLAAGADAAAAGFPWGGPYTVSPARIRGTITEQGSDIFGEAGIPREVYAIRGVVRPGNSGGPLLTVDGQVAGTVFAMSVTDAETGYALTDQATDGWLAAAATLSEPVPTGGCLVH